MLHGNERAEELACARFPGKGLAISGTRPAVAGERGGDRGVEILVHRADLRGEHIDRPGHWVGRDGGAAGERFDHHQAERVGAAWENEDVGGGIGAGEIGAEQWPQEMRVGVARDERGACRAVADDHLGAGMLGGEERLDILLDRDAPDIELDRPAARRLERFDRCKRGDLRTKRPEIDAAAPMADLGEVMRLERRRDRRRRGEDRLGGPVEPANVAPHPFGIHPGPRRNVIGELRVIRGSEGKPARQAPAPRGKADRSLGREMDRVGCEIGEHLADARGAGKGQADLGIGRARHRIEQIGRDDQHLMALALEFGTHRLQGAHDPVDLGAPCIGGDGDPHAGQAANISICAVGRDVSRAAISSAQCSNSILPSKCSTKAVQPSTQSPSL